MKASTVSTQESEVSTESSCLVETQTGVESGVSTSTFDLTAGVSAQKISIYANNNSKVKVSTSDMANLK